MCCESRLDDREVVGSAYVKRGGKIHEKVCGIILGSVNDCDGGQRLCREKVNGTVCQ